MTKHLPHPAAAAQSSLFELLAESALLDESERELWLRAAANLPASEQTRLKQELRRAEAEIAAEQDRHQAALAEIAASLERSLAELAQRNKLETAKTAGRKSFADEILDPDFVAELRKYEA